MLAYPSLFHQSLPCSHAIVSNTFCFSGFDQQMWRFCDFWAVHVPSLPEIHIINRLPYVWDIFLQCLLYSYDLQVYL